MSEWLVTTARLRLRLMRNEDAEMLGPLGSPPGWVEAIVAQPGDRTLTPWAITWRDSGLAVGFCGFFLRPVKGTTMGYAILPEFRGRGLATEAATAVAEWAGRHGVDFYASIRPPNPASVRVLTKIGLRLADSYVDEGGQRDIYRWHL